MTMTTTGIGITVTTTPPLAPLLLLLLLVSLVLLLVLLRLRLPATATTRAATAAASARSPPEPDGAACDACVRTSRPSPCRRSRPDATSGHVGGAGRAGPRAVLSGVRRRAAADDRAVCRADVDAAAMGRANGRRLRSPSLRLHSSPLRRGPSARSGARRAPPPSAGRVCRTLPDRRRMACTMHKRPNGRALARFRTRTHTRTWAHAHALARCRLLPTETAPPLAWALLRTCTRARSSACLGVRQDARDCSFAGRAVRQPDRLEGARVGGRPRNGGRVRALC